MVKMFILARRWMVVFSLALLLPATYAVAADSGTSQASKAGQVSKAGQASATDGISITVNVNTASAEEISTMLLGIGLKKAQAIVDYRTQHGAFTSKQDLTKVKGIGTSTVSKNEARILL